MVKKCFKCNVEKELSEFYVHKEMADGHLNKCKDCTKSDTFKRAEKLTKTDPVWRFKERERHRLKTKKKYNKVGNVYPHGKERYQFKSQARRAVRRVKVPSGHQRHHWSYREKHWEDIFILLKEDHLKIHRYTVYDHESKMYRRLDGFLLDSRKRAETYYKIVSETQDGNYPH